MRRLTLLLLLLIAVVAGRRSQRRSRVSADADAEATPGAPVLALPLPEDGGLDTHVETPAAASGGAPHVDGAPLAPATAADVVSEADALALARGDDGAVNGLAPPEVDASVVTAHGSDSLAVDGDGIVPPPPELRLSPDVTDVDAGAAGDNEHERGRREPDAALPLAPDVGAAVTLTSAPTAGGLPTDDKVAAATLEATQASDSSTDDAPTPSDATGTTVGDGGGEHGSDGGSGAPAVGMGAVVVTSAGAVHEAAVGDVEIGDAATHTAARRTLEDGVVAHADEPAAEVGLAAPQGVESPPPTNDASGAAAAGGDTAASPPSVDAAATLGATATVDAIAAPDGGSNAAGSGAGDGSAAAVVAVTDDADTHALGVGTVATAGVHMHTQLPPEEPPLPPTSTPTHTTEPVPVVDPAGTSASAAEHPAPAATPAAPAPAPAPPSPPAPSAPPPWLSPEAQRDLAANAIAAFWLALIASLTSAVAGLIFLAPRVLFSYVEAMGPWEAVAWEVVGAAAVAGAAWWTSGAWTLWAGLLAAAAVVYGAYRL